jgi:hypothetical protein
MYTHPGGNNGTGAAGHADKAHRTLLRLTTPSLSAANWSGPEVVHTVGFEDDLWLGANGSALSVFAGFMSLTELLPSPADSDESDTAISTRYDGDASKITA